VKKALCVGCNYPSKAFGLAGGVNDAFLLAESLQAHLGFEAENICILHDVYPGQKKSMKVDPSRTSTRVNILHQLQCLVRNAKPGDVLFFSFAGYGLQVDDMDGYPDEGFLEAILPTDFIDGRNGDYTVIVTDDIHDVLMGVPQNCAVTVVMDCDHATSLIDVSGTLDGKLVDGLKYQNFCGLKTHTLKMQLATHNRDVWQEERARQVKARPRFQPMMEIDNPRKGKLPSRPAMSRSSPVAFCFSAAGHGQSAMEMQVMVMADGKETPRQHGILSWCFVCALQELRYNCTYLDLLMAIRRQFREIKDRDVPRMDQEVVLTYCTPLSNPGIMLAMAPADSATKPHVGSPVGPPALATPAVVPPPPPGFVCSRDLSNGGGTGCSGAAQDRPPPPPGFVCRGSGAALDRPPPPPLPSDSTGGTGGPSSLDEAWPPLPPPPPAPPASVTRRCSSELVHHNIMPGEDGFFPVQGGTGSGGDSRDRWHGGASSGGACSSSSPAQGLRVPEQPPVPIATREPSYGRELPPPFPVRPGECGSHVPQGGTGHPPAPQRSHSWQPPGFAPGDIQESGGFGEEALHHFGRNGGCHGSSPPPPPHTGGCHGSSPLPLPHTGGCQGSSPLPLPHTGGCLGSSPLPLPHTGCAQPHHRPGLQLFSPPSSCGRLQSLPQPHAPMAPIQGLTPPNLFSSGGSLSFGAGLPAGFTSPPQAVQLWL